MQMIGKILNTEDLKISSVGEGARVIKQRMACKPILLVLDDVNNVEQLEALASSPDWYFPGSLIIFTGKDKQLLRSHKVDEIYDIKTLDDCKALELFSLYAFGKRHPTEDFEELASQIVKYLQGHPLALKVIGRLFLASDQKRMFLDIACAFIGENKDFAASVLDKSKCYANAILEVLADMQNHTRLWISSEDYDVVNANKVTEEVEVLLSKKAFNARENKYLEEIVNLEDKLSSHDRIVYEMGQSIQTIHMLGKKPNKVYDLFLKAGLGYQNPKHLKKAIKAQPKMYDGERLQSTKLIIDSPDTEETLEDVEESRLKMKDKMIQLEYEKLNALCETFVPQQEIPIEKTYLSTPSISNVPSELSKEMSDLPVKKMPNESKLL
ncbi:NB-ARC domains-containing protein [Tanacetum coccineum]